MDRRIAAAAVIALALALTSCATGAPMTDPNSSPRPSFITTTPGPVGPTGTPAEVSEERWSAIQDDLAARDVVGIAELVSAEAVVFADGSLGCPQPGQSYTQAQVDGMRVLVEVEGTTYDYRFGRGDVPHLCAR